MKSLPLFHRVAGRPVIVLGGGPLAEPKRALVQRAGGMVVDTIEGGWDAGARIAFVALDDAAQSEAAARRLQALGILVNVVDRPDLCDFTTPSILERDPVLRAAFFKEMRLMLYGGAGLSQTVYDRLQAMAVAETGHRIMMTSGYGMTETVSAFMVIHFETDKVGIGLPAPGATVKLWKEAGLRVLPGAYAARPQADGTNPGEGYIRIAMVQDRDVTAEALHRLVAVLG